MGTELVLEAGFRVRFPVFVIGTTTAAHGEPVELFEDPVIGPFVPVFTTGSGCELAIREKVLTGRRVVPLADPAELGSVLTRLGGDEPPWVEFDPDGEQVRAYPVCDVLDLIPSPLDR